MKIGKTYGFYAIKFETGGISFYAQSYLKEEVETIKALLEGITEEEEEQVLSVLENLYMVEKPSDNSWDVAIYNRSLVFYLEGYDIMVTLQ